MGQAGRNLDVGHLEVDRGYVWISVKAKVRPLVVCCCVVRVPSHCRPCDLSMARTDLRFNIIKTLSAHKKKIIVK